MIDASSGSPRWCIVTKIPITQPTISDLDVALTAAHWRWRHFLWAGDEFNIVLAYAEQDKLLEERFKLMCKEIGKTVLYPRS
jgi:hypothetical protein